MRPAGRSRFPVRITASSDGRTVLLVRERGGAAPDSAAAVLWVRGQPGGGKSDRCRRRTADGGKKSVGG